MILARQDILQDFARVLVWFPFRWATTALPPRRSFALFESLGSFAYFLYRGKRALLTERISRAFPDWDPAKVDAEVRACFRNYFADRFIINLIPRLSRDSIEQLATLEGENHLRSARLEGRGTVLVHPHFGPSQLPLLFLGYRGYPVAQMGFREISAGTVARKTDKLRLRLEHQMPVRHFFADEYLRPVLRWLREGRLLMTAGDGTGGGRRIGKFRRAWLLGKPKEMPMGPYRLALNSESPILPVIALREKCGFYRIRIHPALQTRSMEAMQDEFARWFETYLSATPGQWHFWDEWE